MSWELRPISFEKELRSSPSLLNLSGDFKTFHLKDHLLFLRTFPGVSVFEVNLIVRIFWVTGTIGWGEKYLRASDTRFLFFDFIKGLEKFEAFPVAHRWWKSRTALRAFSTLVSFRVGMFSLSIRGWGERILLNDYSSESVSEVLRLLRLNQCFEVTRLLHLFFFEKVANIGLPTPRVELSFVLKVCTSFLIRKPRFRRPGEKRVRCIQVSLLITNAL